MFDFIHLVADSISTWQKGLVIFMNSVRQQKQLRVRNVSTCFYPVLCVAMSCANNASGFFDHLEDDASVNVAHDVGIVWPHYPAVKRRLVGMAVDLTAAL